MNDLTSKTNQQNKKFKHANKARDNTIISDTSKVNTVDNKDIDQNLNKTDMTTEKNSDLNETNTNNDSNNKKVNSVVVSVKNVIERSEVDEVTKLFRKMIGIDKADTTSTVVRQFSCHSCYRAWWKRVRVRKQVSICMKCKVKYDPIPFNKEFGIAEFRCQICTHEFYHWCPKDGFSVCKKCNNTCYPVKILPKTQTNIKKKVLSNASCSSSSASSSSSGQVYSSGSGQSSEECNNMSSSNSNDNPKANTNINSQTISPNGSSYNYSLANDNKYFRSEYKLNSHQHRFNQRYNNNSSSYNYKYRYGNYYCEKCSDTNINLNSSVVFRPHNSIYDYIPYDNNAKNISFCTNCRRIPVFSETHSSTGSTLASLSYQGDLELRFLDDEIDYMEPHEEEANINDEEVDEDDQLGTGNDGQEIQQD